MASKEEVNDKQAVASFSDRMIQKIVARQRQFTANCYQRSKGDLDKFTDCYSDFHQKNLSNLPKVEAGMEWAGLQYDKCLAKTKTNPENSAGECLRDYRDNVEYFVSLLD